MQAAVVAMRTRRKGRKMKTCLKFVMFLLVTSLLPGCPVDQPVGTGDAGADASVTPDVAVTPDSAVEVCDDGLDNDGDGDTDCDDADCAIDCPEFCYPLAYLAPPIWGMAITPADDLDPLTPCIQYEVVVHVTQPVPGTVVCVYLDSLVGTPVDCVDPNVQNPVAVQVSLCGGEHSLYARVERGSDVCEQLGVGLEEIVVSAFENPTCSITMPAGLSTDPTQPTCWTQEQMDVEITTSGADAQLWGNGALLGFESANVGIVDLPGVVLGADGDIALRAYCDNPGTGNGDTWSPEYYITKDTIGPDVQILSPPTGASFDATQCPFPVTVTGVEAGQQVCAHFTGQVPPPTACSSASTGVNDQITLTVPCVIGVGLTVEANTQSVCGNPGQDTILVSADTGIPVILIESPAHGQLYSKAADTIDPATDDLEMTITACISQAFPPNVIELWVDGILQTAYTPTVAAAACLGQPFQITWTPPYPFAMFGCLQVPHSVMVNVAGGSATVNFDMDTIGPRLDLGCAACQPAQTTYDINIDPCPATPFFDIPAAVGVDCLEPGQPISLSVTSGGSSVVPSPYVQLSTTAGPQLVSFGNPCLSVVAPGVNDLTIGADDQAGNPAVPAQVTVTVTP